MMQNSSIIYNCESVLECQMACLVIVYFLETGMRFSENDDTDLNQKQMRVQMQIIFFLMVAEHILSYIC